MRIQSISLLTLVVFVIALNNGQVVQTSLFDGLLEENSLIASELKKEISLTPRPQHHGSKGPHKENDKPENGENDVASNGVSSSETSLVDTTTSSGTGSGVASYVIRMLTKAFRFLNMKKLVKNVQEGRSTPGACITCMIAMNMVKYMIDFGKGYEDVAYVTSYFCKTLNVQTTRVCEGYVSNFMVSVLRSIIIKTNFNSLFFKFRKNLL